MSFKVISNILFVFALFIWGCASYKFYNHVNDNNHLRIPNEYVLFIFKIKTLCEHDISKAQIHLDGDLISIKCEVRNNETERLFSN